MKEANYYEKNKTGIKCQLCNHSCQIENNDVGICQVRKNINNNLFSLVYGQPVSINIDPIEKKPLFHFLPGSKTFSLGTFGCNFRCTNCQNWTISQPDHFSLDYILAKPITTPEKIIQGAMDSGCQSISYTYNEPTVFTEYALDIMKLAHQKGLKNIWVSNGFMSEECIKEITPYLDAINVDLKSFDKEFYVKNCNARLEPILDNLLTIKKNKTHLEITTLIIPDLSDDLAMLRSIACFIAQELGDDVPWHISRFFGDISWKLQESRSTDIVTLKNIYEIGKSQGLKYVYVGNMVNTDMENTFCPKCSALVIERKGYQVKRLDKNGKCQKCGNSINII